MRTHYPGTRRGLILLAVAAAMAAVCFGLSGAGNAHAQLTPGGIQAIAGGPYFGAVGQPVLFNGSSQSSFGFGISQFQWSFGDGSTGFGQTTSHVYQTPGTFIVTLTVIDPSGLSSSASTTAIISGSTQPLAVSAGGPYSGSIGTILTFVGSVSGGSPFAPYQYQYLWAFGDGSSGTGLTTAHAYSAAGTYNVTLTVTSSTGQSGSATTSATVRQALSISAGTSVTGIAGRPVNFGATVTGSTNPQVSWSFGDGTSGSGTFTTHTYSSPGTYTVTATAVDPSTGQQASDRITATIGQSLSVDANGPYSGVSGRPIAVSGSASGATTPRYSWSFGDGGTGTGAAATHTYSSPGTYTITLSVTDQSTGQSASDTATANIVPGGPIVSYPAGWNIVGGPAGTIFSQTSSPLFTLQANDTSYQTYPENTTVQAGWGYWAYFMQLTTVTLSGASMDSITISVPAGQFIMIGNPNANSAVRIKGATTAVSWDPQANAWKNVSSLAPGAGAWVAIQGGGSVTLSP